MNKEVGQMGRRGKRGSTTLLPRKRRGTHGSTGRWGREEGGGRGQALVPWHKEGLNTVYCAFHV